MPFQGELFQRSEPASNTKITVLRQFLRFAGAGTIVIIGEYLGRMFNEAKRRPLYIVKDYNPPTQTELSFSGEWKAKNE